MLGHVQKIVFQAATPNTSAGFILPGDSKAFGGSVYMPGATAAKLEYSIDNGATWIGPAAALTVAAPGFFTWAPSYFTMPHARVVATAGTATDCRVYVVE